MAWLLWKEVTKTNHSVSTNRATFDFVFPVNKIDRVNSEK
jgi:hypothetical protein